jgi:thiol-disulfide isomerase/thioredoxin
MNDTTRQVGGNWAWPSWGSVLTSSYTSSIAPALQGLPASAATLAGDSVEGATAVAAQTGHDWGWDPRDWHWLMGTAKQLAGVWAAYGVDVRQTPLVNFFASWCEPCHEDAPIFTGLPRDTVSA